jgi:hypothetical protein
MAVFFALSKWPAVGRISHSISVAGLVVPLLQ